MSSSNSFDKLSLKNQRGETVTLTDHSFDFKDHSTGKNYIAFFSDEQYELELVQLVQSEYPDTTKKINKDEVMFFDKEKNVILCDKDAEEVYEYFSQVVYPNRNKICVNQEFMHLKNVSGKFIHNDKMYMFVIPYKEGKTYIEDMFLIMQPNEDEPNEWITTDKSTFNILRYFIKLFNYNEDNDELYIVHDIFKLGEKTYHIARPVKDMTSYVFEVTENGYKKKGQIRFSCEEIGLKVFHHNIVEYEISSKGYLNGLFMNCKGEIILMEEIIQSCDYPFVPRVYKKAENPQLIKKLRKKYLREK